MRRYEKQARRNPSGVHGRAALPRGKLLSSVATLSKSPSGAESRIATVAEELALSGASVASSIVIPDRAIVFGVSTRTTTAITGAASYDCGISGEPSKFDGSLGIAEASTNAGVIGPQAFYADTAVTPHSFLPMVPGV
ncbi:MAG: hypothetical protein JJ902_20795 [Roseibium sp.]|nr:hypothetical protein [Roseibium sp.]